jgi:abhydrolase domain-containing protein 4
MNTICIIYLLAAQFLLSGLANETNGTNTAIEFDVPEPSDNWLPSWMSWTPTSQQKVREAEENLMQYVETESIGFYVNIGTVNGEECRIWTRKFGLEGSGDIPLVMIHGMGAGLAMFALNFDSLAKHRVVYAIDLPGFARSSRINFSNDPSEIENEYTKCIERWQKALGLKKINLLGHSFGGYLTALYALKYPENINLAVLADPWGMTERPSEVVPRRKLPVWVKALGSVLQHFNPLAGMRAIGPAGPWLMNKIRPDLKRKYEPLLGTGNSSLMSDYIFHCNAQNPTGESAFTRYTSGGLFSK